jgi:CheY-like chemotaxis protein
MERDKSVLLIDDDEVFHLIHRTLLLQSGLVSKVHVATNGVEAIEKLQDLAKLSSLPDMILVDIDMPVMDGFQFIEAYSRLPRLIKTNTFIAILSSSQSVLDKKRSQSLDIKYFLSKPLDIRALKNYLIDFALAVR